MLRNDGAGEANLTDILISFPYPSEDLGVHVVQLPHFKDGETVAQKATAAVPEALAGGGAFHTHVSR